MKHALVLVDGRADHPRTPWRAACACGEWTGRPCRHRHDAVASYRRHLAVAGIRSHRTAGYKPRQPTPAGALPIALQPLVVTFT